MHGDEEVIKPVFQGSGATDFGPQTSGRCKCCWKKTGVRALAALTKINAGYVSRRGMLWVMSGCTHPQCDCSEVLVQAISMADSLVSVRLTANSIETTLAPDPKGLAGPFVKRTASATVDISTGEVKPKAEDRSDAELLTWLKAELDAEAITALRGAWNFCKGRAPDAVISQHR